MLAYAAPRFVAMGAATVTITSPSTGEVAAQSAFFGDGSRTHGLGDHTRGRFNRQTIALDEIKSLIHDCQSIIVQDPGFVAGLAVSIAQTVNKSIIIVFDHDQPRVNRNAVERISVGAPSEVIGVCVRLCRTKRGDDDGRRRYHHAHFRSLPGRRINRSR
jgi:hypothetical protein